MNILRLSDDESLKIVVTKLTKTQGCGIRGIPVFRYSNSAEPPNTGIPPPQARYSRYPTPLQLGPKSGPKYPPLGHAYI